MHNLQNTVIDEITIKRLLRLKSRNTEVSLRLLFPEFIAHYTENHLQGSPT